MSAAEKRAAEMAEWQCKLDQAQQQIEQQQTQIDTLQKSLQESVNVLQQQQQQLQVSVQEAKDQANVTRTTASQAGTAVAKVESSVASVSESLGANEAAAKNSEAIVQQTLNDQETKMKTLEEPNAIHYKGLTITPGGFLEATALMRTRNENADLASSFTGIPLNGTSNSKLSELRGTARDSRLSMLVESNAGSAKLTGYVEGDFLGAAPIANFVQSSVVRQKSCNVIPEDFAGQMNRDRLGYDYPVAAWLA